MIRDTLVIIGDTTYEHLHGQGFSILRDVTADEADIEEIGPMFVVKAASGEVFDAFWDEVYYDPNDTTSSYHPYNPKGA